VTKFSRLTVPYVFVIGFMATIVPHLSWGLYWDGVVGMEASCEKNGWLNVLYVNNFYRQDEQVSKWPCDFCSYGICSNTNM